MIIRWMTTIVFIIIILVLSAEDIAAQPWSLNVSGKVKHPMTITGRNFQNMPHLKVAVTDSKGATDNFEGVSLYYLLDLAGAPLGDSTEGKNQTWYLQAGAIDGYKVIFALPEIDTSFTKNRIIVADRKNGGELNQKEAPLEIVVQHEQRHARWIRQLTTLKVLQSAE